MSEFPKWDVNTEEAPFQRFFDRDSQCPDCGCVLDEQGKCDYCGYTSEFWISDVVTKRIRMKGVVAAEDY